MDCSMPGFPVVHSLSPRALSNSCPLSQWCYPIILLSVPHFSFCPQSFPASGSFPMSWPFTSHGQNIGASVLASKLPKGIKGWFPLGLTDLISLLSKGLSRVFSSTTVLKHQFFAFLPSLWSSSHNHVWPLGRPVALTIQTFVGRVMSLFFNTLSRFVIALLPRSNHLLISWLQSPSAAILKPKKRKSVTTNGARCHDLSFLIFSLKPALWLFFHLHQEAL